MELLMQKTVLEKVPSGIYVRALVGLQPPEGPAKLTQISVELYKPTLQSPMVAAQYVAHAAEPFLCLGYNEYLPGNSILIAMLSEFLLEHNCSNPNCQGCTQMAKMSPEEKTAWLQGIKENARTKAAWTDMYVTTTETINTLLTECTPKTVTEAYVALGTPKTSMPILQKWTFANISGNNFNATAAKFLEHFGNKEGLVVESPGNYKFSYESITGEEYAKAIFKKLVLDVHPELTSLVKSVGNIQRERMGEPLAEGETPEDLCINITRLPGDDAQVALIPKNLMGFRIFSYVEAETKAAGSEVKT